MATAELSRLPHPDDAVLAEYAQGDLLGDSLSSMEAHVARCSECREVVAGLLQVLEPSDHGPRKGLVIGRYVVLDAVGAGAIGEVFSAYDSTLDRTVALKWLYPSVLEPSRASLRERLLLEARALAKVQHPNVVVVHDVLAQDDADVIVMELVKHARRLKSAIDGSRDARRLVEAFVDAGRGLAAAHAAGVIHRDFKPDNVLVDGTGRVVVVDFGLARHSGVVDAPSSASATKTSVSGTPAYLAPERWQRAPADAATDQFSFCVALFECLTGRLPFQSQDVTRRLEEIRKGPPPLGGSLHPRVEQAIRRGLSFEAQARWPSMTVLTDELAATFRPTSSRRWLAGGAVAFASVAALTVGLQQRRVRCESADAPVRAVWTDARQRTIREAFKATSHPAAELTTARVLSALSQYAADLGATRRRACEATAFEGESEVLLSVRQTCAARRLADFEALLGGLEKADGKVVEKSVLASESLADPRDCLDPKLASVDPLPKNGHAAVEAATAKVAQARATRLLGRTKDSVELATVAVKDARSAGWAPLTSDALYEQGMGLERLSKFDDARAALTESMALGLGANDAQLAFSAATLLAYMEGVDRPKVDAAAAWLSIAHALEPRSDRLSSEQLRLRNAQAIVDMKQGRLNAAVTALTGLSAALEASGQLETVNGSRVLTNLSAALRESGKPAEAVEASKRSIALMEKVLTAEHPDVAAALNNLGSALADDGRLDEAAPQFRRAVELRERLFGPDALVLATPHYNLGELAFRRGDGTTALAEYGRSRAIIEKTSGPDEDDVWDAKMGEGLALGLLGRHQEARTVLEQVLPELERRKLPAWNVAQTKLGLARSLRALKHDEPRVQAMLQSVASLEGPRHAAQVNEAKALLLRTAR